MTKDLSNVPVKVTLTNTSDVDVAFRYYRVNFVEVLKPADEVIISAASSEEAAYYLALADEKIGLTAVAAE